jgi:hypothetical protein
MIGRALALAVALFAGAATARADKGSDVSEPNDQLAEKRIQEAVAKARGMDDPSRVDVTIFDDVKVPGVLVWKARVGKGQRGSWSCGVLAQGHVELEREKAIAVVIRAWGYGAKRTAPVTDVAEVVGELLGNVEPAHPITSQNGIDNVPDQWRAKVSLPKEIVEHGKPGIEFWVRMGRPSLARARVTFATDGAPHIELSPVGEEPEKG